MSEKIKPCPFPGCGGSLGVITHRRTTPNQYAVACDKCWCEGPRAKNADEAIALWNSAPRPEPARTCDELLDVLYDVTNQACAGKDGAWDSMALTAYAEAMRLLAEHGRLEITEEFGRRVIAKPRPSAGQVTP